MTLLGRHLVETGQLREEIGLDEVRDVLWNYLAIDHYERLVLSQGWSHERYSRWLAGAITSASCPYGHRGVDAAWVWLLWSECQAASPRLSW